MIPPFAFPFWTLVGIAYSNDFPVSRTFDFYIMSSDQFRTFNALRFRRDLYTFCLTLRRLSTPQYYFQWRSFINPYTHTDTPFSMKEQLSHAYIARNVFIHLGKRRLFIAYIVLHIRSHPQPYATCSKIHALVFPFIFTLI